MIPTLHKGQYIIGSGSDGTTERTTINGPTRPHNKPGICCHLQGNEDSKGGTRTRDPGIMSAVL